MKALNPYLNFNGNCEEAFNYYRNVFKSEFAMVMRFNEVPAGVMMDGDGNAGEAPVTDEGNLIMHVALPIGPYSMLMGSDVPSQMGQAVFGSNIALSINVESKEEADRVFAELSEGGAATMPMDNAFWGDYFGMLTDKFGIQWMVSFNPKQPQQ